MLHTKAKKRTGILLIIIGIVCLHFGAIAETLGVVNTKSLVLRKAASKDSKALQTLRKGDEVSIHSSSGDWYKVSASGYKGYVMKEYVKASAEVKEIDTKESSKASQSDTNVLKGISSIQDIGDAPETTRPGDKGKDVKKLQQALKLKGYYSGKIDGVYGDGTESAVVSFQKKHGLSKDGIAGKVTIKLLFGEEAANAEEDKESIETEKLDWFNGGDNTIPKNATFTVKDVKTGKTFIVTRWSGSNHIDAEPNSKEDTATLKSIYGGSWSWRRRAVLIKYNGHVYAGSMNGMPHGTSTISGNGFDGHFCIHFYKSKTHGSKKVDDEHQNMVERAMKATW